MTKSGSANLKCCFYAKYLRANGSASKCSYIIFLGLSDKKAGTPIKVAFGLGFECAIIGREKKVQCIIVLFFPPFPLFSIIYMTAILLCSPIKL